MDSIGTRPVSPIAAPTRNTGPLRPVEEAQPSLPAENYDPSRRGELMNEASQFEYGDMPWGEDPAPANPRSEEAFRTAIQQHLHDPNHIKQGSDLTCVAAGVQRALAWFDKGTYERVANELLAKGSAQLPNGATLHVSPENLAHIESLGLPANQHLDHLVQTAIMDYANGEAGYDAQTGESSNGKMGLSAQQAQSVFESMLGGRAEFLTEPPAPGQRDAFINQLRAKLAAGTTICLPLNLEEVSLQSAVITAQIEENDINAAIGHDFGKPKYSNAEALQEQLNVASQMSHLVEVAEISQDGTITIMDPKTAQFSKLSLNQFMGALAAAAGDDVGGTLSYNMTSQRRPPSRPPAPRPPAPPPPPPPSGPGG